MLKPRTGHGPITTLTTYIRASCCAPYPAGSAISEKPFSEVPFYQSIRLLAKLNLFRHTKPGGYFELQELDCRFLSDDGSLANDSQLSYWSKAIVEAAARYNRPIPRYDEYYDWFVKAGFVDVQQVVLKCPTNPWPKDKRLKEVGKYQCLAHIEGLEGVSLGLLTRGSKWKADEVSVLMARVRPELKDRSIHSYQMK